MKLNTTVSVCRALSQKYGVNVVIKGHKACTNGKTIYVPDLGEMNEEKLTVLRGYIDHEAGGHGKFTDFNVMKKLTSQAHKNLFNIIEDIRCEAELGRVYPGCKNNLTGLNNYLFGKIGAVSNPHLSLLIHGLKVVAGQEINGETYPEKAQGFFGEDVFERVAGCKTSMDALKLAANLLAEVEGKACEDEQPEQPGKGEQGGEGESMPEQPEQPEQPEHGDESADVKDESGGAETSGEGQEGNEGKTENLEAQGGEPTGEGQEASEGEETGCSDAVETQEAEAGEGQEAEEAGGEHNCTSSHASETEQGGSSVAEGKKEIDDQPSITAEEVKAAIEALEDFGGKDEIVAGEIEAMHSKAITEGQYLVYSKEADKIIEVEPADDDTEYKRLRDSLDNLNSARAKMVRVFQAEKATRWVGDRDNGKINNRALAKVSTGNNRVFKERYNTQQVNTAATFLVDFSGSMCWSNLKAAMQSVILFIETLEQAGVKNEVLGYTTGKIYKGAKSEERLNYGRIENLITYVFKTFDERKTSMVKRRISNWEHGTEPNENCDPCSLEVAYNRLVVRPEKRKILFVLTDGAVANKGCNYTGMQELKRRVAAIEKAGKVEIIAIDLMSGHTVGCYSKRIMVDDHKNLSQAILEGVKKHLL